MKDVNYIYFCLLLLQGKYILKGFMFCKSLIMTAVY